MLLFWEEGGLGLGLGVFSALQLFFDFSCFRALGAFSATDLGFAGFQC